MSAIQNGTDLTLKSSATDYTSVGDTVKNSGVVDKGEFENTITDKQNKNKTTREIVNESDDKQALTTKQLDKVAQQLQDFVGGLNRNIEFSVDEDSGKDVIKVIDKDSGDILKQYPSEEVLTLVSKLSEMVGGLVDEKV
jgi:flagellar protein FlaG